MAGGSCQAPDDRSHPRLKSLRPETARVLRDGQEQTLPISKLRLGDEVLVRPGERIRWTAWYWKATARSTNR